MEEIIGIITDNLRVGEEVFRQDIHAVGEAYCIGKHNLTEVLGGFYSWDSDRLSQKEHAQVKEVLNQYWEKHGKMWKDRGLY